MPLISPSYEQKRDRKALLVTVGPVGGGWRNPPIPFLIRTRLYEGHVLMAWRLEPCTEIPNLTG